MSKPNKELYAELATKLKVINADLEAVAKFAEENQLTFSILGARYIPNTNEVRSSYSDDMEPTEDVEPTEDSGFYSPDDRGTFWVSSNC